jgi:hypothetical protein
LGEILQSARTGAIHHPGDAGQSEYWVCFTTPYGAQTQRIWVSAGELGGPEHTVGGVYGHGERSVEAITFMPGTAGGDAAHIIGQPVLARIEPEPTQGSAGRAVAQKSWLVSLFLRRRGTSRWI